MKESTVSASEFRAKCLRMLDEVAEHGRALVITKHGRPVAKVVPVRERRAPMMGRWKGIVQIKGDIVNFNAVDDWQAAR